MSCSGTLLAVPIVNGYGLISHSRYMPDRRDLNRSFPGSDHGSLASILADLLMREVVLGAITASTFIPRRCTGSTCRKSASAREITICWHGGGLRRARRAGVEAQGRDAAPMRARARGEGAAV